MPATGERSVHTVTAQEVLVNPTPFKAAMRASGISKEDIVTYLKELKKETMIDTSRCNWACAGSDKCTRRCAHLDDCQCSDERCRCHDWRDEQGTWHLAAKGEGRMTERTPA